MAAAITQASAGQAIQTAQQPLAFDIPSQPLISALKAFGAVTGIELFYDSKMIIGRNAAALRGRYTPDQAMAILLQGTGLSSASFDPGTLTILQGPNPKPADDLKDIQNRMAGFTPYLALVQESLRQALCRNPIDATDPSNIFVQLWIAPSGSVDHVNLIVPTGDGIRDEAYIGVLQNLDIGEPPPPDLPEPLTLMLQSRTTPAMAECLDGGPHSQPGSAPNG